MPAVLVTKPTEPKPTRPVPLKVELKALRGARVAGALVEKPRLVGVEAPPPVTPAVLETAPVRVYTDTGATVGLSVDKAQILATMTGKSRFKKMQEYGIISKDAVYVEGGYIPAEKALEIKKASPELYAVLVEKGVDAFKEAVKKKQAEIEAKYEAEKAEYERKVVEQKARYEKEKAEYEKGISEFEVKLKDMPLELQEAYKEGGIEGYNRVVKALQAKYGKEYQAAIDRWLASWDQVVVYEDGVGKIHTYPEVRKAYEEKGIEHAEFIAATLSGEATARAGRLKTKYEKEELPTLPPELKALYFRGREVNDLTQFNKGVDAYNLAEEQEFLAGLKNMPVGFQRAFTEGGIEGYNKYVNKVNAQSEKDLGVLNKYKLSPSTSQELIYEAWKREGMTPRVVELVNSGGGWNLVDLVSRPIDRSVLVRTFGEEAVKEAEYFNIATAKNLIMPARSDVAMSAYVKPEIAMSAYTSPVVGMSAYYPIGSAEWIKEQHKAGVSAVEVNRILTTQGRIDTYLVGYHGGIEAKIKEYDKKGIPRSQLFTALSLDAAEEEMKQFKAGQDKYYTLKQVGLEMIPFYGRTVEYERRKRDGLSASDIAWLAGGTVLDLLIVIPIIGGVASGVRISRGLGAAAQARAIARSVGRIAVAEIKAPYTMIRHPVQTGKVVINPFKVLFQKARIPTAAASIRHNTIRLPAKYFGSLDDAMDLRDAATFGAIKGGNTTFKVGGKTLTLNNVALQKLGVPVAIHATDDIRPFLEGAVITVGREGGMFVAPSLYTRFSAQPAFGAAKALGKVKGGLLINDPKILKLISPSGKVYKGTTELEALLKAGIKLPASSQVLRTADAAGDTLTLLVIGKPYTTAQLAKLKIMGTVDTIVDIFKPAATLKGKKALALYDDLLDLRDTVYKLTQQANKLRKQGKLKEATKIMDEIGRITTRANRLASRISRGYSASAIRVGMVNLGTTSILDRVDRITGRRGDLVIPGRAIDRIPERRAINTAVERRGSIVRREAVPSVVRQTIGREMDRTAKRTAIRVSTRLPAREAIRLEVARPPARVPPARITERVPPVRPPTRVPPVRPPERVPPVRPPTRVPPRVPPPPVILRVRKKKKVKEVKKPKLGRIAWRQGALRIRGKIRPQWYVLSPPYKTASDIHRQFTTPKGAKVVKGIGSAYKSIQQLGGNPKILMNIDMGIMDIRVTTPKTKGQRGAIKFKRDVKQKTRSLVQMRDVATVA